MIYFLDGTSPDQEFPPVEHADAIGLNGLLAVGGDLTPRRLINAYSNGIFPWYGPGNPILWYSPDPRLVLFPQHLHISRSLRKTMRNANLTTSMDQDFSQVIRACAAPRDKFMGSWLNADMIAAYEQLHILKFAHSVEVWEHDALVGGLYGVALGQVFFGESMFSKRNDASKIALVQLVQWALAHSYHIIDCQVRTRHLLSMGAVEMPRHEFIALLKKWQ